MNRITDAMDTQGIQEKRGPTTAMVERRRTETPGETLDPNRIGGDSVERVRRGLCSGMYYNRLERENSSKTQLLTNCVDPLFQPYLRFIYFE